MKMYYVGGYVRDRLLGVQSKDVDLLVLAPSFEAMREHVLSIGVTIFDNCEKPEFGTIRGKHPEFGAVDFVLPRKDGVYSDARRPDSIEVAENLYEDSLRRDFSINAMYEDIETGEIIDYHGGRTDLGYKLIRTVGNAQQRFEEDELRRLRAMRFAVTKGFDLSQNTYDALDDNPRLDKIAVERIRGELFKMFEFDTRNSWTWLQMMPNIRRQVFDHKLIMVPTIKSDKKSN